MSVRGNVHRATSRYPRAYISLSSPSASTSKTGLTQIPTSSRRPFSSTSRAQNKPRSPSLIGRFFGAREPAPVRRDPAQVVRDAADTLRVLLRTTPPVRPALLHKPYAELVTAILAYRNTESNDPLDLTTAGQSAPPRLDLSSFDLAGDRSTPPDALIYISHLLAALTAPSPMPHPAELQLALELYSDMSSIFSRTPTREDTLHIIRAHALLRQPAAALSLASTLDPPLAAEAWAPIACALALSSPESGAEMRTMMRTMAARGVEPPPGAWCALLGALRPEEVAGVVKVLPARVKEEPRVWTAALEVLVRSRTDPGPVMSDVARALWKSIKGRGDVDTRAWAALVLHAGRTGAFVGDREGEHVGEKKDAPFAVVRAFDRAGGSPDGVILQALIRAIPLEERLPSVLRRLESVVGVAADEGAWGVLVDAVLERGYTAESESGEAGLLEVWAAAQESGVSLTSATLDRIVGRTEVPVVDRLRVYRSVHTEWPAGRESSREISDGIDAWTRREDALSSPGPTVETYTALLGALATAGRGSGFDRTSASAAAVELLTDMRQRGIKLPQTTHAPPSPTRPSKYPRSSSTQPQTPASISPLAAITLLLMQGAPSHEAAFKMYAYARVVDPGSGAFGAREYRQVLRVFAELKIAKRQEDVWKDGGGDKWVDRAAIAAGKVRVEVYAPPPAALYYEIMRDMQRAGYEVGAADYTTILKSYVAVSIPMDAGPKAEVAGLTLDGDQPSTPTPSGFARAHNAHVLEHIQRIHTLLKLDTNLTPDTALLNALMNAYGHASALDNALAVWDQIRPASRDGASVSIILDALGHAGPSALPRAKQLWKTLRQKQGARLNANHYTSWVEALCRMGEFEEAERVVFVEMRDKVRPDEKTLRTLVSFAWRVGKQAQVLENVRREFPEII